MLLLIRRSVVHLDVFDTIDPKKVRRIEGIPNADIVNFIFTELHKWLFGGCTSIKSRDGATIKLTSIEGNKIN